MYLRENKREESQKENDLEYRKRGANPAFNEQKSPMTGSAAALETSLSQWEQELSGDPPKMSVIRKAYVSCRRRNI